MGKQRRTVAQDLQAVGFSSCFPPAVGHLLSTVFSLSVCSFLTISYLLLLSGALTLMPHPGLFIILTCCNLLPFTHSPLLIGCYILAFVSSIILTRALWYPGVWVKICFPWQGEASLPVARPSGYSHFLCVCMSVIDIFQHC